jgi:hypothetical protein
MRIQDMLEMLPPREDMFRVARYFGQPRGPDYTTLFVTAAAGLVLGAGVALLFAPNTGRELRRQIGERAEVLRERARERAQQLGTRIRANDGAGPHAHV